MEDREKFSKWLRQLATVAEHLDIFRHDAALENSRRAFGMARLADDEGIGQPGLDDEEVITRVMVAAAEKLAAWTPPALADTEALAAACMQAQAAAWAIIGLLKLLPDESEQQLHAEASSNMYWALSGSFRMLMGPASSLLQPLQQGIDHRIENLPPGQRQGPACSLLVHCTMVLNATTELLNHITIVSSDPHLAKPALAAVATSVTPPALYALWARSTGAVAFCQQHTGSKLVHDAHWQLCNLTSWVLDGVRQAKAATLQQLVDGAAALMLGDRPTMEAFLRMLASLHRHQVQKLLLVERRLVAMPADALYMAVGPWRNSAQLLRHPKLAEQLRRVTSLADTAASGVALLPTLLRCRRIDGGLLDGDVNIMEALLAVPHSCGRLLAAPSATQRPRRQAALGSSRPQVPGVCWEGLALCCASLQAVLERAFLKGTAAAADEARGSKLARHLPAAMGAVGRLMMQIAPSLTPEGCKTAVAPEHAAAAAAALEAAVRLCGRLWQGQEQLEAALGSVAAVDLGNSVTSILFYGPQAVAAAMEGSQSVPRGSIQAMKYLVMSLGKALLVRRHARSGFAAVGLAHALGQLRTCLCPMLTIADSGAGEDANTEDMLFLAWSLQLSFGHIFAVAVDQEAGEAGSSALVSCAVHLAKLALDLKCTAGMGKGASTARLDVLAVEAVRKVTANFWVNDEAKGVLETLLQLFCRIESFPPQASTYLLQSGILEYLIFWAAQAARYQSYAGRTSTAGKVLHLQRKIVELAVGVARVLLKEWAAQEALDNPTLTIAGKARSAAELQQFLSSLRSSQQLRGKPFWEKQMQVVVLLARSALVQVQAAAAVEEPSLHEEARALSIRPCTNPLCINMRGCSEARLRGRRCSCCGVARYCSRDCQTADWARHSMQMAQTGLSVEE